MNKKLPTLYVNKIEKKLTNNKKIFYSAFSKEQETVKEPENISVELDHFNVEDKIDDLFNSPNYVYKMNATITLRDQTTINKDIIGQTNGKLITIDEDLIDINDIRDIRF